MERRESTPALERRQFSFEGIEFREPGETGGAWYTLAGHAAVFNLRSLPLFDWLYGVYEEKIAPGAFERVLARDPDVHLAYVHDMASAMARTRAKSLELREDGRGLRVWARLDPADTDVQRVAPKLRSGVVDQMSFAFTVERDEWLVENEGKDDQLVTRTILEVGELYEVSIVPQGAYPQTDAGLRGREIRALIEGAMQDGRLPALPPAGATPDPAPAPPAEVEQDPSHREVGGDAVRRTRGLRARARAAVVQFPPITE